MSGVILTPVASSIEPACEDGLRELERRGYTVRRVRGYAAIDQGRCQMATDALAEGFEETIRIDSDIGFSLDDVEKLRSHQKPIVAGIYPQKGRRALATHLMPGTEEIVFGEGGGLIEVKYAATGFLLVRREVYETMQKQLALPICNMRFRRPLVPYFQPMIALEPSGPWYLAEDFAFCERARQCGYQIFADTSIRLRHYGSYGYSWEDAGGDGKRYKSYRFRVADGK